MKGFLAFTLGCATVAALTLLPPENARWIGLSILAALFVLSAIPRRVSKPGRRRVRPVRGTGSFDS